MPVSAVALPNAQTWTLESNHQQEFRTCSYVLRRHTISYVAVPVKYTMNSSLAEIAAKTGKQPRIIYCLNDQANMACFMCLRGV